MTFTTAIGFKYYNNENINSISSDVAIATGVL
jgi:hypothetical protein